MKTSIFLVMILVFSLLLLVGCTKQNITKQCVSDSDCVPAECCHAASCISVDKAPNCKDTFCTEECVPRTMDCGQGSCGCSNGKCTAVII